MKLDSQRMTRSALRGFQSCFPRCAQSEVVPWSPDCPRNATRGKGWGLGHEDYTVESEHHSCYVPTCA